MWLLSLVVVIAASSAPPAGYIVAPTYYCVGIVCPTVELATFRFTADIKIFEHSRKLFNVIVPPSDPRDMHFPVRTAYGPVSRAWYTATLEVRRTRVVRVS
jgi:hypothetical protein